MNFQHKECDYIMDIETTMTNETKPYATSRIIRQAGLGQRLRAARESMRISEKDAAIRLHLNPRIIAIMENEEFENGPPETFMRGYIRSYGRLLSIPDSEICAALTQIEPPIPVMQPGTSITITRPPSYSYLRGMTYVVVAILAVLVSVWWTSHPKDVVVNIVKPSIAPASVATPTIAAPVIAPAKPESAAAPIHVEPTAPATPAAPTLMQPSVTAPPAQNTNAAPSVPSTTAINPAAPAVTSPPTPAKPALDDMDMSLSDPSLNQGDDGAENNENDTKYNKTPE